MKDDYTHIAVILDRTGSMESIRDDVIGGFNAFVREQKEQPGKATLTLVQFDSQDPYEVIHRFARIHDVPELTRKTYVPRATTPLLDALGRGIIDLDRSLAKLGTTRRPGKVVFVVITDGQENASREFRKDQIVKMIRDRSEKNEWEFVFLSADLAAIEDAVEYGVRRDAAMHFDKTGAATVNAMGFMTKEISMFRSGKKRKIGFEPDARKASRHERKRSRK